MTDDAADNRKPAPLLHLEDFRAAKAHGGWHQERQVCTVCGHRQVSVQPVGTPGPCQCGACGAMACVLDDGADDGPAQPDPHAAHRARLIVLLTELLRDAQAGHVDGAMIIAHHSPRHPGGTGWATCYTGNLDFVTRLGGLELVKIDMIAKANAPAADDPDPAP